MEKKITTILKELGQYFDVHATGSKALYDADLITMQYVSDYDIVVLESKWDVVKTYLRNEGFTHEKDSERDEYGHISFVHDTLKCTRDGDLPIHLIKVTTVSPDLYKVTEILKKKIDRSERIDLIHILEWVCKELGIMFPQVSEVKK